jgi:hypothetical protein
MNLCRQILLLAPVVLLTILLCGQAGAQAERVVPIASGDGVIEDMIAADAPNRAINPNTWYELERNGYYTIKVPIANAGYHLKIRAASGPGKRPIVRPFAGTTRSFAPAGDLTLQELYINGVDAGGTLKQNSIRTGGANIRITIKGCQLDRDLQSVMRVESAGTRWFVTGSVISNLGLMADNNGRAWDDRGQNVDTLIMHDNIIYNLTGRMMRDGGGILNYFKFDHNTVYNNFDHPIAMGEVKEAHVANNLFINTRFMGTDTSTTWGSQVTMIRLRADTAGGTPQIVRIHHNNFHTTPGLLAGYTGKSGPRGPLRPAPVFDSLTTYFMRVNNDSASNKTLAVTLLKPPLDEVGPMQDYWDNSVPTGSKRNLYAGPDSGKGTWDSTQVPWDFRYSSSHALYTAGSDGLPVGVLYVYGLAVGVNDPVQVPATFGLAQNFPNPFNPSTTVEFSLTERTEVSLIVYSVLGREVATLARGAHEAGVYRVNFDAAHLPSGVYFYRLIAGTASQVRKMTLLK